MKTMILVCAVIAAFGAAAELPAGGPFVNGGQFPVAGNPKRYCWVDVVAKDGGEIVFSGDRPCNLPDPVFSAKPGETNRVLLLMGKPYRAKAGSALSVVGKSCPEIETRTVDDRTVEILRPVVITSQSRPERKQRRTEKRSAPVVAAAAPASQREERKPSFSDRNWKRQPILSAEVDGVTWRYSVEGGVATIEPYMPIAGTKGLYAGDLVIPSELGGSPVRKITRIGFCRCTDLASVVVPEGVEEIEYQAFDSCTGLCAVTLPKSLKKIGFSAFQNCTSLKTVKIVGRPEMGSGLFRGCSSLTDAELPKGLKALPGGMFEGCVSLTNVVFPSSLQHVGRNAFKGCAKLDVPDRLKEKAEKRRKGPILSDEEAQQMVETIKRAMKVDDNRPIGRLPPEAGDPALVAFYTQVTNIWYSGDKERVRDLADARLKECPDDLTAWIVKAAWDFTLGDAASVSNSSRRALELVKRHETPSVRLVMDFNMRLELETAPLIAARTPESEEDRKKALRKGYPLHYKVLLDAYDADGLFGKPHPYAGLVDEGPFHLTLTPEMMKAVIDSRRCP